MHIYLPGPPAARYVALEIDYRQKFVLLEPCQRSFHPSLKLWVEILAAENRPDALGFAGAGDTEYFGEFALVRPAIGPRRLEEAGFQLGEFSC